MFVPSIKNVYIQYLNLSYNNIESPGIDYLFNGLARNGFLKDLNLDGNNFYSKEFISIEPFL